SSGAAYVSGLVPAVWVGVAVVGVGALVALVLPRRLAARASSASRSQGESAPLPRSPGRPGPRGGSAPGLRGEDELSRRVDARRSAPMPMPVPVRVPVPVPECD
ncbi:MAG TPA: hypothetical protein VK215_00805, partial [Acidimicrobiales bacterium]|nr:hypothetical protein [Acidimicrobiales bacterium]